VTVTVDRALGRVLPPCATHLMHTVTLYTRRGCHLCEVAKAIIDEVRAEQPFELVVIDVDRDPALRARYTDDVPVIAVDGREAFRHHVAGDALRDALRPAPPRVP
jgi:glutaredoxin